ncbi:MAG: Ig-like domain-containing protein [Gemmatimonadales bacterium]
MGKVVQLSRLPWVLALAGAFACADGFAPGQRVTLSIVPVFSETASGVLSGDLDALHLRITRIPSSALVIDTTVAVDSSGNVDLPLTVPLLSDPEQFEILLEGVRATDAAVLYQGLDTVQVSAGSATPPPVEIPVSYVGPCGAASGCAVTVGPLGTTLAQGDSVLMSVLVDSSGVPVLGVPVSLVTLDTALVRVRASRYIVARTGTLGGSARVVARIHGDEDTLAVGIALATLPAISLNPTSVSFNATAGGASPASKTVSVTNASTGTLSGLAAGTISYGVGGSGWLATSFDVTTAPATLTLTATTGSLAPATYTATVPVTSAVASNSPQNLTVSFIVTAPPPASVIVTPGYAAIRTTTTVQLADTVKDASGNLLTPTLATWTSRTPSVATVNPATGLVTGVSAGAVVIVATAGSAKDSTLVTVGNSASAPGDMLVAALTNSRAFGTRRVGQRVTVDVRVEQVAVPADSLGSYNARYTWNPAVLRFDSTSAGTYAAPTVNSDSTNIGVLRFAAVDANSKSGALVLTRIWFTALTTGADGHNLQITELSGVSPNFFNYFTSGRFVVVSGAARITP